MISLALLPNAGSTKRVHGQPKLGLGGRGRVLPVMSLKFEKQQPHESFRVVVQCDEVLRVCENQINRDDASCSGDISHCGQKDCTSPQVQWKP